MIALHFVVQRQKVEDVTARAPHLEVRKEVRWFDFSVDRLGIPELLDPCVGDDGADELCRLLLRGLVRRAICALCFMHRFCARADDGRIVVVD